MAGSQWKKILAAGLCGLMAAGVLAGCGMEGGAQSCGKRRGRVSWSYSVFVVVKI